MCLGTDMTHNELCIWVAAILDGEGFLSFSISKRNGLMTPFVGMGNTNKVLTDTFSKRCKTLGVVFGYSSDPRKGVHKNIHRVQLQNHAGITLLLNQVEPFLIIKRMQAQLILLFCGSRTARGPKAPYNTVERKAVFCTRQLNKKGRPK